MNNICDLCNLNKEFAKYRKFKKFKGLDGFCFDCLSNIKEILFVYGLIHPMTKELKYIGYTNNLQKRYRSHLSKKERTIKYNWIISLKNKGFEPELIILETYNLENDMKNGEIFWIEYMKYLGCELTNGTDGGDGASCGVKNSFYGKSHSPEAIEKFRNMVKNRIYTDEERKRRSENMMGSKNHMFGKHISDEQKAILSKNAKNRVITQEIKDKISAANTGQKRTEEQKKRLSEALKGRVGPMLGKKHSESAKDKVRQAKLGKPRPQEMKDKLSQMFTGEGHPQFGKRKLSPEQQDQVIYMYNIENKTMKEIAKIFKVNRNMISLIIRGLY